MPNAKAFAKWGLIGIGGLLATAAAALALGTLWLRSDSGRTWLVSQIEAAASTPGEMELTIGRLEGDLTANLTLRDIVLRDAEGAWLTVAGVEVDWRPWALLDRTLEIDGLALSSVELARLPAAPAEPAGEAEAEDAGGLPRLPLKVRIGRLSADEIALGAPVLGQAARFTLVGVASSRDDGGLSAGLDLERLDGVEATLRAELDYDPDRDSLTARIDATEAPGGLLATLLEVPDLPRAELHLAGSGPLSGWDGDFTLSLGEVAQAQADIGLQRAADGDLGFRLKGHATVSPPAQSPAQSELWDLAAGRTDLTLEGAWREARLLQLETFSAANDNLQLTAKGEVEPAGGRLNLTLDAAANNGAAIAGLLGLERLENLSAGVVLSGTTEAPEADIALQAGDISSPDFAAAGFAAQGRITTPQGLDGAILGLDLTGRVDAPRLPGEDAVNQVLGTALPFALQGSLDLGSSRLEIASLEASLDQAALTAQGPFDLAEGTASLETTLTVSDLAALQPLTEIALGGRARLAGPLTLASYGSVLDADLSGRWDQPSSDIGLITAVAGGGLDVTARLAMAEGTLRLEQLTAQSPKTQLTAALTVAGGELRDGRYSLVLTDSTVLAGELGVDLAGAARVEGTLSGPFDALDLGGTAEVARLNLEGQSFSDLSGNYDLRIKGGDIDGPISLALSSPFGRGQARGDLQVRADAVKLSALEASVAQTTVRGEIAVPLDGGDPQADLRGEIADLGPWLAFADLSGVGKGEVTLKWNQPGAAAPLLARADLSGLRLQPGPDADPLDIARLTLNLEAQDPALAEPGTLKASAESLRWQQLDLAQVNLDGRGTAEDLDLALEAKGDWIEPVELQVSGRVARQGETTSVTLREAEGRAFGQPLTLRDTATLTLAPSETRLQGLDLASGDTRLTADARLGGGEVTATASLDALPLTTVEAFWPSGLDGMISARLDLQGPVEDPRGSAKLTATGLRPQDGEDLPTLDLASGATWRAGRVKLQAELGGAEVTAARFNADVPLRLTPEGSPELPQDGAISGALDWSGGIDTVLLFVPLPQHRLGGDAEVALTFDGTVGAPKIDGSLALADGSYENLETGTVLRDLQLRADLADDRVQLTTLTANDGDGGKVSGNGNLRIDPAAQNPLEISIRLDDFHALRRDDVTAVASGTVRIDGTTEAPRIEGRFTTQTVEISLLTNLPPNVVTLDIIEVKDGVVEEPAAKAEAEPKAPPPVDAELDIVVEMPNRVFVRGRGLDSEWAGRISVQGSAASPQVSGDLNVVRGQMSVVGKTFVLQEGKVTLPEGANAEPTINVAALHEGEQLDVTATLSGPLTQPELDLASSPEVPRDEIISRVLFNKSAANLTAAEAAQLALAVRELTGKGGGTDILGFARRSLGVDVLRVDTTAEGNAAVEAGKYLTDEVYIGVKQGATSKSTGAEVEVELTPNITIESEVTGDGANKSGVRFQLDY